MGTVLSTAVTSEPLLASGVPGSTDYTFRQLRALTAPLNEGVLDLTDLKVSQRGAGANLSVDVAAGLGVVAGDTITGPDGQHKYIVPVSAVKNLGGITAPTTNPRRDIVVQRVYDQLDIGDATTKGELQYIRNASETLVAEATPANCQLLAYVDVTVGASAITNAMITDRRNISGSVGATAKTSNVAQSPTSGTEVLLDIGSSGIVDPFGWFDVAANQINIRQSGLYVLSALIPWALNGTGQRWAYFSVGGSYFGWDQRDAVGAAPGTYNYLCAPARLSAGDVVTCRVAQNSGGPLATSGTGFISIARVAA